MKTLPPAECYRRVHDPIRYRLQRLAFCLAGLAGYVDAIGFLGSGGLFVSFMSGNSTRMAIGIMEATTLALAAATLIALFVSGMFLNIMATARITIAHRKVPAISVVAVLLLGAACCKWTGFDMLATGLLCVAMGASNTIFRRDEDATTFFKEMLTPVPTFTNGRFRAQSGRTSIPAGMTRLPRKARKLRPHNYRDKGFQQCRIRQMLAGFGPSTRTFSSHRNLETNIADFWRQSRNNARLRSSVA